MDRRGLLPLDDLQETIQLRHSPTRTDRAIVQRMSKKRPECGATVSDGKLFEIS